jgi:Zn-dependent metalloprotease
MRILNGIMLSLVWLFSISLCGYASEGTSSDKEDKNTAKRYSYASGTVETSLKSPKKGDPLEMAYEFLELNKQHFRMKEPRQDMVPGEVSTHGKITRVTLKQVYHGIGVDAGARIWFNDEGEVHLFEITYYDDIDLPKTPSMDSAAAENVALKDVGLPENTRIVNHDRYSTRLTIWRDHNGKLRLIWVVWVKQEHPKVHFWEYYIDALDGTVLYKVDKIRRDTAYPVKK